MFFSFCVQFFGWCVTVFIRIENNILSAEKIKTWPVIKDAYFIIGYVIIDVSDKMMSGFDIDITSILINTVFIFCIMFVVENWKCRLYSASITLYICFEKF